MSLILEIIKPKNIDVTSRHLLTSSLANRLQISDGKQAEVQLLKWLQTAIENEKEENLNYPIQFLPLYKGYWAHLVITENPKISGNLMESTLMPAVKVTQGNALDVNNVSFTVNKPSARSGTKIVNANFLVDLGKWC